MCVSLERGDMNHPSEAQLIELASRRLPAGQVGELTKHVAACPQCAIVLKELEEVHLALGTWRERTSDIELVDRVQQALDAPSGSAVSIFPWWLRSSAVAASLVISIVGGHLLARRLLPPDEQGVVLQSAIADHLQLVVLAEPDRTGLSDVLTTETDFDGVTP